MKEPVDHSEEAIADALRRDAALLPEPPFDPALHAAVMRRLRTRNDASVSSLSWWKRPALAAAAVLAILAGGFAWRHSTDRSARGSEARETLDFSAVLASTQAAINGLPDAPPSPLPAWISPTAPLLDFPPLTSIDQPL